MAVPITLGGFIGTSLLLHVPTDIIKYLMATTIIALLIHSYIGKKPDPKRVTKINYLVLVAFLFVIGIYSNFITAGEGAFSRMGIMAILGLSFLASTGIKATATMPSRIYSLVVTGFAGLIVWPYLLTMLASNFIAGKYATKFAKRLPDRFIKLFLTIVSLAFVVYLLVFY